MNTRSQTALTITVVAGTGVGETELSAFDKALNTIGVSNFNLIPLSSIIPPHSEIRVLERYNTPSEEFGDRLYVVKAEQRSSTSQEWIGAGIGWYQVSDGRGLFVEHETKKETKEEVEIALKHLIMSSLQDLCMFRNINFAQENVHLSLAVTQVLDKPACALSIAVFKSERW